MEIITKTEGNKATMEISGWLDTQTAPQLGEDYKWPVTDDRYLENAIAALDRLTFFD